MNSKVDKLFDLPPPPGTRAFFDPQRASQWVKENSVESFKTALNKIETPDFKLKVSDVKLHEADKPLTLRDLKQATLDKKDITIPIKGKFQLIDKKTGKVVDEKTTTIAHIPYVTDHNTVVVNGSEYIVTHQQRLKPGVYTRIKESGEAEAHVNVLPGTGVGGKLIFYPDKALFVYSVGTTEIKLYGLLKDLGVSDQEMLAAWGKEIFEKNKRAYDGTEIDKFYAKIFKYDDL